MWLITTGSKHNILVCYALKQKHKQSQSLQSLQGLCFISFYKITADACGYSRQFISHFVTIKRICSLKAHIKHFWCFKYHIQLPPVILNQDMTLMNKVLIQSNFTQNNYHYYIFSGSLSKGVQTLVASGSWGLRHNMATLGHVQTKVTAGVNTAVC